MQPLRNLTNHYKSQTNNNQELSNSSEKNIPTDGHISKNSELLNEINTKLTAGIIKRAETQEKHSDKGLLVKIPNQDGTFRTFFTFKFAFHLKKLYKLVATKHFESTAIRVLDEIVKAYLNETKIVVSTQLKNLLNSYQFTNKYYLIDLKFGEKLSFDELMEKGFEAKINFSQIIDNANLFSGHDINLAFKSELLEHAKKNCTLKLIDALNDLIAKNETIYIPTQEFLDLIRYFLKNKGVNEKTNAPVTKYLDCLKSNIEYNTRISFDLTKHFGSDSKAKEFIEEVKARATEKQVQEWLDETQTVEGNIVILSNPDLIQFLSDTRYEENDERSYFSQNCVKIEELEEQMQNQLDKHEELSYMFNPDSLQPIERQLPKNKSNILNFNPEVIEVDNLELLSPETLAQFTTNIIKSREDNTIHLAISSNGNFKLTASSGGPACEKTINKSLNTIKESNSTENDLDKAKRAEENTQKAKNTILAFFCEDEFSEDYWILKSGQAEVITNLKLDRNFEHVEVLYERTYIDVYEKNKEYGINVTKSITDIDENRLYEHALSSPVSGLENPLTHDYEGLLAHLNSQITAIDKTISSNVLKNLKISIPILIKYLNEFLAKLTLINDAYVEGIEKNTISVFNSLDKIVTNTNTLNMLDKFCKVLTTLQDSPQWGELRALCISHRMLQPFITLSFINQNYKIRAMAVDLIALLRPRIEVNVSDDLQKLLTKLFNLGEKYNIPAPIEFIQLLFNSEKVTTNDVTKIYAIHMLVTQSSFRLVADHFFKASSIKSEFRKCCIEYAEMQLKKAEELQKNKDQSTYGSRSDPRLIINKLLDMLNVLEENKINDNDQEKLEELVTTLKQFAPTINHSNNRPSFDSLLDLTTDLKLELQAYIYANVHNENSMRFIARSFIEIVISKVTNVFLIGIRSIDTEDEIVEKINGFTTSLIYSFDAYFVKECASEIKQQMQAYNKESMGEDFVNGNLKNDYAYRRLLIIRCLTRILALQGVNVENYIVFPTFLCGNPKVEGEDYGHTKNLINAVEKLFILGDIYEIPSFNNSVAALKNHFQVLSEYFRSITYNLKDDLLVEAISNRLATDTNLKVVYYILFTIHKHSLLTSSKRNSKTVSIILDIITRVIAKYIINSTSEPLDTYVARIKNIFIILTSDKVNYSINVIPLLRAAFFSQLKLRSETLSSVLDFCYSVLFSDYEQKNMQQFRQLLNEISDCNRYRLNDISLHFANKLEQNITVNIHSNANPEYDKKSVLLKDLANLFSSFRETSIQKRKELSQLTLKDA